jgi:DNA/RNA non-specific endonuclease
MPRRRSTRRRSRQSGSLGYLLVAVVVVLLGWLLIERGVLPSPSPPASTRRPQGGESAAENRAAVRRLGGAVDYGTVNAATGQRSGIRATITPAMVAAAGREELGSPADPDIRPPGYDRLPARNRARGHLLGRQLGGSGAVAANLVAMYQTRANSPVMRDYETPVAEAVRKGETVRYAVRPIYGSRTADGAPAAIRITATGDRGLRLDVTVANTPDAAVTETVAPTRGP